MRGAIFAAVIVAPSLRTAAAAAPLPAPAMPPRVDRDIAAIVEQAARRFAIPAGWIYAVMRRESAGDVHAVSPKGASGLMQIMPATWAGLRLRYGLGGDIFDPRDNILAGAAYLRELYDRYGSPGFLAAYNTGPGRYEAWLVARKPLPDETLAYVAAVGSALETGHAIPRAAMPIARSDWSRSPLFAGADEASEGDHPAAHDVSQERPGPSGSHPSTSTLSLFAPIGRAAASR